MELRIDDKPKQAPVEKSLLTSREIEYLSLVALGYQNNEIALILSVTTSTVRKTLESIFRKLDAKTRTHAVTIAFLNNLLNRSILDKINYKFNLI